MTKPTLENRHVGAVSKLPYVCTPAAEKPTEASSAQEVAKNGNVRRSVKFATHDIGWATRRHRGDSADDNDSKRVAYLVGDASAPRMASRWLKFTNTMPAPTSATATTKYVVNGS